MAGFLLFPVACNDLADEAIDRVNPPGRRPLSAGVVTRSGFTIIGLVAGGSALAVGVTLGWPGVLITAAGMLISAAYSLRPVRLAAEQETALRRLVTSSAPGLLAAAADGNGAASPAGASLAGAGPAGAGDPDAVGQRRAAGRAGRGDGRGVRLPAEIRAAVRAGRGGYGPRRPGRRCSRRGWPGWSWVSTAGWPGTRARPPAPGRQPSGSQTAAGRRSGPAPARHRS